MASDPILGDDVPEIAEHAPARGALTILCTDIEGSTALTTRLGEANARELFREHERIVREALKADLLVYEGVSHGDYAFEADSPEFQQTYSELSAFLSRHLQSCRQQADPRDVGFTRTIPRAQAHALGIEGRKSRR